MELEAFAPDGLEARLVEMIGNREWTDQHAEGATFLVPNWGYVEARINWDGDVDDDTGKAIDCTTVDWTWKPQDHPTLTVVFIDTNAGDMDYEIKRIIGETEERKYRYKYGY